MSPSITTSAASGSSSPDGSFTLGPRPLSSRAAAPGKEMRTSPGTPSGLRGRSATGHPPGAASVNRSGRDLPGPAAWIPGRRFRERPAALRGPRFRTGSLWLRTPCGGIPSERAGGTGPPWPAAPAAPRTDRRSPWPGISGDPGRSPLLHLHPWQNGRSPPGPGLRRDSAAAQAPRRTHRRNAAPRVPPAPRRR